MAISMVRKPSETPNITNIDDIIPFRYAYGNQSGYVINRGAEVSHTVNGNQFTVNSGRLVIQGVESDIDANGITFTIDSVSETRYYAVYHEINLATNTSNIKVEFDTATYPNITEGDDLTANSSGIARLLLYRFDAINGEISNIQKEIKKVEYLENLTVKNSKKVNDVEIKKDNNNILKAEDDIIPRKKTLWSGRTLATISTLYITFVPDIELKANTFYEFELEYNFNSNHSQKFNIKIHSNINFDDTTILLSEKLYTRMYYYSNQMFYSFSTSIRVDRLAKKQLNFVIENPNDYDLGQPPTVNNFYLTKISEIIE